MIESAPNFQPVDSAAENNIPQGIDTNNIDSPADALNGFNLQNIESGDPDPGKPKTPTKPTNNLTREEFLRQNDIWRSQVKNWAQTGVSNAFKQSYSPFQSARLVTFDAKKFNVDRYLGYGKTTFNKVGFSPFLDNEKNFNEQTTIWQDYGRMASVFLPLAYEGGVSGYRSIGSLMSGGSFFDTDDETAENFARLQGIGYSSRGGLGAFTNNLTLNMAYTVGIGTSILAEEAALWGATALTRGATAELAALRTGQNVARFGSAMNRAFNAGKSVTNILQGSTRLAKSLTKVDDAKAFYSAFTGGAAQFGKGALQFLNPLARTTDDLYDIYNASSSVRNLSNFAKMSKTFGSFYRDVRGINLALSEGKLEGGSAKLDKIKELVYQYEQENGKPPEGKDLEKIYETAEDIGNAVTMINLPVIFYSNKITLDGLFKFRGFKTLGKASEEAALMSKGIGFKAGTGFYDAVEKSWTKNLVNPFKNPRAYMGRGLNYFKANFAEGLQESMQEVISKGASDYYTGIYNDPTLGGFEYGAGKAWEGIKSQISAEGAEIFASGFLMGGMMHKATNFFLKDVPNVFYWSKDKVKGTNKLEEYKEAKRKEREEAVRGLNELYNDPTKYFSADRESLTTQKHTSDTMDLADANGDAKTFQDAKDLKTFDHVFRALRNGSYDNLLDGYRELMKLDDKDLADFLKVEDITKAKDKLQEVITRAEEIKNRYNVIEQQFGNPFDYKQFKKGTPEFQQAAMGFVAYEKAKQSAVLAQHSFDRALDRMNKLYSDLVADVPVSNSTNSDYQVLTDISKVNSEISLLRAEIKTYDESDKDQKKLKKQKSERLEALLDYKEKLSAYLKSPNNSAKPAQNGQIEIQFDDTVEPLKESYKNYLKHISNVNNGYVFNQKIDESFGKLIDYYGLNKEAKNYNDIANHLLDPTNMIRHSQSIRAQLEEIWADRENLDDKRVASAQRLMEINELVKALVANDIMVEPSQMIAFVTNGTIPTVFYDANTKQPLVDSQKLLIANELFSRFQDIQEKEEIQPKTTNTSQPAPQPAAGQQAPVQEAEEEEPQPKSTLNLEPELEKLLLSAFDQFVASNPDIDIEFEEFVKQSPAAARIKKEYEKSKQQPTSQTKPEESKKTESTAPPTQEEKPVSNLEAKKADIERRREISLRGITQTSLNFDAGRGYIGKYNIAGTEIIDSNGKPSTLFKETESIREDTKEEVEKELNAKYDAELAALEGKTQTEENKSETPASEQKSSGIDKAKAIVDSISSIKDFPDLQKADSTEATIELMNLIQSGEVSSKEVRELLEKKKTSLLNNIKNDDIEKGDIVTLKNGSKGVVFGVNKNDIKVKVFGTPEREYMSIKNDDIKNQIRDIRRGKPSDMTEEQANVDITPGDQQEVEASKDTMVDFKKDADSVKKNIQAAEKSVGTDNKGNLDDLLSNIGCKNG